MEDVLEQAMKTQGRSIGLAPLTLNLGTRGGTVVIPHHIQSIHAEQDKGDHRTGDWVSYRPDMNVLDKRKNSFPYWESNPRSSSS